MADDDGLAPELKKIAETIREAIERFKMHNEYLEKVSGAIKHAAEHMAHHDEQTKHAIRETAAEAERQKKILDDIIAGIRRGT